MEGSWKKWCNWKKGAYSFYHFYLQRDINSSIILSIHPFFISFCVKLKVSGKKLDESGEWRRGNLYQEFGVGGFSTFFLYHRHWLDSFGGTIWIMTFVSPTPTPYNHDYSYSFQWLTSTTWCRQFTKQTWDLGEIWALSLICCTILGMTSSLFPYLQNKGVGWGDVNCHDTNRFFTLTSSSTVGRKPQDGLLWN